MRMRGTGVKRVSAECTTRTLSGLSRSPLKSVHFIRVEIRLARARLKPQYKLGAKRNTIHKIPTILDLYNIPNVLYYIYSVPVLKTYHAANIPPVLSPQNSTKISEILRQ